MSFTAPRTWVAAEIVTAANMNTHVRDNMKAAAGADKAACRVYNSANISHATSGVEQAVTFDSERFDTQAMHSTVTNTSRITIATGWGGQYLIGGAIRFATVAGSTRRYGMIKANAVSYLAQSSQLTDGTAQADTNPVTLYALAAGDYVELMANQFSGAALNMEAALYMFPEFWCIWQGTG